MSQMGTVQGGALNFNQTKHSLLNTIGGFDTKTVPPAMQSRPHPKLVYCDPEGEEDVDTGFVAKPADDIPHNRLTDKLCRGIQSYVQRMQKREGYRIQVLAQEMADSYIPAPRECSSLTSAGFDTFLIGGSSSETIKEISKVQIMGDRVYWEKINYKTAQRGQQINGRQAHSCVHFRNKLYIFGGCFSFNRKRNARECTNQLLEFDYSTKTMDIIKTNGVSASLRKNHTAVTFKNSMIVFGGSSENGMHI